MSKINDALMGSYLTQLFIVAKHQDLAANNQPNQLGDMIEALNLLTETIGNSNCNNMTSIDEDCFNIKIQRTVLGNAQSELN